MFWKLVLPLIVGTAVLFALIRFFMFREHLISKWQKEHTDILADNAKPIGVEPIGLKRAIRFANLLNSDGLACIDYFLDEDHDFKYMYVLLKIMVGELKMWFIFYPNPDYYIAIMIFDRRICPDVINAKIAMINEFYGKEGTKCDSTDAYPDYVWDRCSRYDSLITGEDMRDAAEENPDWTDLYQQFL